ncbi:MAG: DUF721 domain-containing protein [Planctomycetia bacterium]|nr:DUF721 domain-containing protein [Planctomycetia bacterium]
MFDPKRLVDILAELHARRGYARVRVADTCDEAWREAVGESLIAQTRLAAVRRGVAEITAANSMVAQELQFQKERIVARLAELLPEEKIRDLRCKIGPVS